MKKVLLLLIPALLIGFSGCKKEVEEEKEKKPQVEVPKENKSLTQKVTGTRCPPCGSWGWTIMDDLMSYGKDRSIFISTYSQNFVAEGFITTTATEMDKKWGISGYPTFVVNGSPKLSRSSQGVNTAAEKQMSQDAMDAHKNAIVVANVGINKTISGNTLNIKTSTQFFANVSGEYKLALYVVEDKAMWKQSGHPQGTNPIPHHYVLRNSVSGTWGETVSSGDVVDGKFFDKDYTFELNETWNKDNIYVVGVIWKVDGDKFFFVNANKI